MYLPPHFAETRIDVLHEWIARNPFGTLVTRRGGGLDADHLPFDLDPGRGPLGALHAHVARANPLWRDLADGDEVMVVFGAGDAYVAPGSFPSKRETGRQVPTWNYRVAHAHGRITIRDDEAHVRAVVARLTRTHEAAEAEPWTMADAPPAFIEAMLKAVVGIEIEITRLVGKAKLSQNKPARDVLGAAEALQAKGETTIAAAMLAGAAAKAERA